MASTAAAMAATNDRGKVGKVSDLNVSQRTRDLADRHAKKSTGKFGAKGERQKSRSSRDREYDPELNASDSDSSESEQKTETTFIGDVLAYAKLADYDKNIRRRNLVIFILTLFCYACFMLEIWLAYDKEACFESFDSSVSAIDNREKSYCIVQSPKTNILKAIISFCTVLHILCLVNYYRFQLKSERNSYWFVTDSMSWRRNMWWFLALEVIVCLPHPFPTGEEVLYDDKLGSLMFLRLYTALRVLRDHSPIYRRRQQLLGDSEMKKTGGVEFNWLFCVKFLFLEHTWLFVTVGVLITWFTMAYVIWIFEREHNPNFNLQISFWMTCITMTTVGYGDVTPTNNNAKVAAGATAVLGIINAALLVFAVMDALTLSPQDLRVKNLWSKKLTLESQKLAAANYIRLWWEHHLKMKQLDIKSPDYKRVMLSFNAKNAYLKGLLLTCRRDLTMAMELDDLVIDRLEEKLDEMTGNIADRLSYRMGLRPNKKRRVLTSTIDLATRVSKLSDDQKKILGKIDQVLKVLLHHKQSILGKIFHHG